MSAPKPSPNATRRAARLAAAQALYQMAITGVGVDEVRREFIDHRFGMELAGEKLVHADAELFGAILAGAAERGEAVNDIIRGAANREPARIEPLLLAILKAGVAELLVHQGVDAPVIINEYVEVAHAFYEKAEAGLVNAVMDRAARQLRPADFA